MPERVENGRTARHLVLLSVLPLLFAACQTSRPLPDGAAPQNATPIPENSLGGFATRLNFSLTTLDGRSLPTRYADPRGNYSLISGELILDRDRRVWISLELEAVGDYNSGPSGRKQFAATYRRVGADSIVFPEDSATFAPEFFGHFRGQELVLVARPSRDSRVTSVARDFGGVHTWRFSLRQ